MSAETIRTQLERAKEKLARLEAAVESAHAKSDAATPGGLSAGYDSAVLSGIRRKPNHKADNRRWSAYTREAEMWQELENQRTQVRALERRLKAAERPLLAREDVEGAAFIRTAYGWHKVARINKTTVSVETGYSWTDRYTFDKILEVRKAAA